MNKAEREHLGRVAELTCAICGDYGTQVHHIREGQGMAQRSSHWLTVPLCVSCHTGPLGIHGDKSLLRVVKKTELDLLADTYRRIYGERLQSF